MIVRRLKSSVSAWIRRVTRLRATATFRRSGTNLDALMGIRTSRHASSPRTRILSVTYRRAPGRAVDWPGEPPAEWKRRHPEQY